MSKELLHLLNKFSAKNERKLCDICSPVTTHLGIAHFLYFNVEENGTYSFLTNDLSYTEFYFGTDLHLTVPYYAHPSFFRSGHVFTPCAFGEDYTKPIHSPYARDHLFLILEASEKKVEGFCYYNKNFKLPQLPYYLEHLDVLIKFNAYFKREAKDLIEQLKYTSFNMQQERGKFFLEVEESLPLSKNIKIKKILKEIYGLSPQEQRCFELFKKGHSAQATGALMGISRRTVETYFSIIKEKLNCSSKWDLLNL